MRFQRARFKCSVKINKALTPSALNCATSGYLNFLKINIYTNCGFISLSQNLALDGAGNQNRNFIRIQFTPLIVLVYCGIPLRLCHRANLQNPLIAQLRWRRRFFDCSLESSDKINAKQVTSVTKLA